MNDLPCAGIPFGSYKHHVSMRCPWNERWVCIDACLATEIAWLWLRDVRTIESCCGHGKLAGYIAVEEGCVEEMRRLGYLNVAEGDRRGDNAPFFYPKCHGER